MRVHAQVCTEHKKKHTLHNAVAIWKTIVYTDIKLINDFTHTYTQERA